MTRKIILWSLILLVSPLVYAQDLSIDSITIQANRLDQHPRELGKSVTIISAQDVANIPVTTIDDLLRYVAGINLNARGAFGTQTDIGMRGSTFSQVVILIDNARLNDPLTSHFNNNFPISMAEIGRIEIIRGPLSAAYGADAVGGIIHIKTKTYLRQSGTDSSYSEGMLAAGENNLNLADIGIIGGGKNWLYSAGVKASISDGETLSNPNYPSIGSADSLYANWFNLRTFSSSVKAFFGDGISIQFRAGADQRAFNAKYFYTASLYDESEEEIKGWWTQMNLLKRGKHSTTEWNLAYKKTNDVFTFNPLFAANAHETKKYFSNLNHQLPLRNNLSLALGLHTELKSIESTDRGDHSQLSNGLYSIVSGRFNNFHPTASIRLEYDQNFGLELVPQFSASYNHRSQVFRFSFGKAIRAADFTERFISYNIDSLLPGRNAGNPDLRAERSYTLDIGYDHYFNNGLTWTVNAYTRWSNDLIDFALTNSDNISNLENLYSNSEYLYATNISAATTSGLEILLHQKADLGASSLQWAVNYSLMITDSKDSVASKYIANHPRHMLNTTLCFTYQSMMIQIANNTVLRNKEALETINGSIPAQYNLLQIRFGFALDQERIAPFIQVNNLLNTNYQEILGAQMPGRWLFFGFNWKI